MENLTFLKQHEEFTLHVAFIKPFENIALAFSGGGFKAASFSLGVLSYLNKLTFDGDDDPLQGKRLLQQVTYMSSASGGTITTTLYALYSARGKKFKDFYVKLFNSLAGDVLLQNALEILSEKRRWRNRPDKSRNIINAFALAYDEYIFEGQTVQSLYNMTGHLQEVCFNTTEFYTGLSFRQDTKLMPDTGADPYYKFGNENIFITHAAGAKLKLGDVLAASSCFPGGFEPIMFPNDFTYEGLNSDELKNAITLKPQTGDKQEKAFIAEKRIGFMDGGITDNQGLQSMMYADGRRIRRETSFSPFDLMLVNDVGGYFITPYVMPPQSADEGMNLRDVDWITFAVFLAAVACIIFGVCYKNAILALLGGIFIVVPWIFLYIVRLIKKEIKGSLNSSSGLNLRKSFNENIIKLAVRYFTKTPLVVLKQMLRARMDSVMLLTMQVFMKRIRQLLYNKFYGSAEWRNRGKSNHIYDLSFSSDIYRKQNPPPSPFLNPSRDMQIVAQTAFNMGTTLWFDKETTNSKGCIIACGQFTTCYNLLGYIEKLLRNPSALDARYIGRVNILKLQMENDYAHFKADPFFMYNQDGLNYQIKDFVPLNIKDIPFPDNW